MEAARAMERDKQILREEREQQDRMAQEEREHQKAMFELIGNTLNSLGGNREAHHSQPHAEPAAIHSLAPPPSTHNKQYLPCNKPTQKMLTIISIHCKKGHS